MATGVTAPSILDCISKEELAACLTNYVRALQVRALAVCRAWKDHLDPKQWPVIGYDLDGSQEAHHRIASWICATQPALRALSMANFDQPQLLVTLASVGARTVRAFCEWPLEYRSGRRSVDVPPRRAQARQSMYPQGGPKPGACLGSVLWRRVLTSYLCLAVQACIVASTML